MYGLPADFDATVLSGCEVEAVCFYQFTLVLVFREGISISLASSFKYSAEGEREQAVPVTSSTLMQLTGKAVVSATASTDGTLALRFNDGQTFTCLDPTDQYESYSSQFPDKRIIV